MSDPVSHAEIEDVLSSIRRLVSEDNSNKPATPEPAARLVLTPALRVQDPDSPTPQPGQSEQSDDAAQLLDAQPAEASEQSLTAEDSIVAAVPDLGAEQPIAFHRRPSASEQPAPEQPADTQSETEDQPLAEDQPDVAADPSAPWGNPEATLYAAADAAQLSSPAEASDDAGDASVPPVSASVRAASVLRQLAEMEARNPQTPQWEPDNRSEPPFAGIGADSIEWRDEPLIATPPPQDSAADVVDITAEPAVAAGPADADKTPDLMDTVADVDDMAEAVVTDATLETLADTDEDDAGDTYLDEDALRDLVASIVREELQGPLGERITRNVRKLVRREIHRALAAHDLL